MTIEGRTPEKGLEYYLSLSYEITVQKAEEGGFVVSIPALPGCITQVENEQEVLSRIEEVRKEWITTAKEDGVEIPLPKTEKEYSGKFVVRLPKSMHRKLDIRAEDEGVSLNTLLISMISLCLGSGREEVAGPAIYSKNDRVWKGICRGEKDRKLFESKKQPVPCGYIGGTQDWEGINYNINYN